MRWIHVARVAALLLVPFAVEAAELSEDQQKCVNTMSTQLRKVGSAVGKEISACLRDYGKGRNGVADIAGCVSEDRTGKLRKASAKTATLAVERCGGEDENGAPRTPGVFCTDADTVNREAAEKTLALLDVVFGSDIEGAAFTEEENQAAARCQEAVVKRLRKCGETQVKEFNECKRAALQAGQDPFPAGAQTEDELASCLLNDARGRIAKACDLGEVGERGADKIRKVLDRKCGRKDVDLSLAFPTCGSQDAEVVHGCLETPVECLSCRAISSADALGVDCDLLDNGLPDGSCSTWEPVPRDRVAAECGLDPDLLSAADAQIQRPYAVVRYGKLCHEFYPEGPAGVTSVTEIWSTTKTLGAVVTGMAAYQTRDLPRTGRKTGPLSDEDRVDHWLDDFSFNPEARVGHVLAMVAHNPSLDFGAKEHEYDAAGNVQVNRLSDIVNTAIAQDPLRLGSDLEEFTQRFLFEPLRMRHSTWSGGAPDKIYGYTWDATVRDMARLGLLILNGGVWEGERLVAEEWIYRMTHPAFEDANTGYGYLTWLASRSNWNFGGILGGTRINAPIDPCSPAALHSEYPHGLSASPDCNYLPPYTCDQDFDVGAWHALGMGGQFIAGHPGLDLLLVAKDMGDAAHPRNVWDPVRPALVALDPQFAGDEAAFCAAYGANAYAPDL